MKSKPPEFGCCIDQDIDRSLEWFLGFLSESEWNIRKQQIEKSLETILQPRTPTNAADELQPISIQNDRIGIAKLISLDQQSPLAISLSHPCIIPRRKRAQPE